MANHRRRYHRNSRRKSRIPWMELLGIAAVAGGGYYLYSTMGGSSGLSGSISSGVSTIESGISGLVTQVQSAL